MDQANYIKRTEHEEKLRDAQFDGIAYGVAGTLFVLMVGIPILIVALF